MNKFKFEKDILQGLLFKCTNTTNSDFFRGFQIIRGASIKSRSLLSTEPTQWHATFCV